jgi:protein-disulfide isomerase-like protein with CxxC motif
MANIAASVAGLNLAQWRDDTNGSAAQASAKGVDNLATQINAQGTPTILVGPTGGKLQMVSGRTYDPAGVDQALAAAVANS